MNRLLAVTIVLMAAVIFSLPAMAQTCKQIRVNATLCDGNNPDAPGWIWSVSSFEKTTEKTAIFDLKNSSWEKFGLCVNLTLKLNTNDEFNATTDDLQPTCINDSISYILNKWDNWTTSYSEASQACNADPFDEAAVQSAIWFYWYMNESTCKNGFDIYSLNSNLKNKDNGGSDWIPNCTAHPQACWLIDNVTKAGVNVTGVPTSLTLNAPDGFVNEPIEITATVYNGTNRGENVNVRFELIGDAATNCSIENNGNSYTATTGNNGNATVRVKCSSLGTYQIKAEIVDWKKVKLVDPQACPNQKQYQETLILDPIVASDKFNVSQNPPPTTPPPTPPTTPPPTNTPPQVSVDSPTNIGFLFAVIAILGALLITRKR